MGGDIRVLDLDSTIVIQDWTGEELLVADCVIDLKEIEAFFKAASCEHCKDSNSKYITKACEYCNDTGYASDFHIEWRDKTRDDNVYEWVNY